MNIKKKWTKLSVVALLVAVASFTTAGLVFADHFPPVASGSMSSLTAYQQYQAALDHAESSYQAAFAALPARAASSSSASFLPYPDEFDRSELDRRDVIITTVSRASASYLPYLDEFDRMELHWQAVQAQSDDSLTRWHQYLMFAK